MTPDVAHPSRRGENAAPPAMSAIRAHAGMRERNAVTFDDVRKISPAARIG
jgi:hypothetical protein